MDQSALELRSNRLLAIKQELSKILERPGDPGVWWEKFRASGPRRLAVRSRQAPSDDCLTI